MPPILASLITLAGIVYLFRRDFRERPNVTGALWLPTLWFFLIGSRTVAQWLQLAGIGSGGGSYEEGTPVDAAAFFLLILAGAYVLRQRRVRLGEIIRNNRWLAFFLAFCFVSILWSDLPFVAFKRWIKILGHPIMTLVLFTEPEPEEAVARMVKRCAYVIVPVSILFIKYYPAWGRTWSPWGGPALYTGITLDKNTLGSVCLILGLFYFWHTLQVLRWEKSRARRLELFLCAGFLAMIAWLLHIAHSSTSTVSLAVGIGVMLLLGFRFVDKRNLGIYLVVAVVLFGLAESLFGVFDFVVAGLGKDPTLTDRMPLWKDVLTLDINPIIGTGFESFWDAGPRRDLLWRHWWWHPIQAHNGYLETYLNLGLVGLALMLALMLAAFAKIRSALLAGSEFARFRMGFLAAFVLYNWTEAAFKAVHPVWFVFYLVAIYCPAAPPGEWEPTVVVEMAGDAPEEI